ncbi:conserved hypothetical protein [Nostocoides japonicum T1-X7]|uniref:Sensory transduction regulator n=1 Tax=Nostocoides japonicum T1-X7 TaxID=1194083 RepID=A0A077M169_9MICO|nr:hypothetical protein [Tetrasphaera japonica]CCH78822.1 conserved hypothetical protein [Tetrasphaera japonica T1-X7]
MSDPTALPNFPPPPDEHPLRGRVLDSLLDMGLQPDIDADGDVAFVVNEQQLFIRCIESELTVMRTFGQWQIGEEVPQDTLAQLTACNEVNLTMNLVKTGLANGTLVVTTEHLVRAEEDVSGVANISIQVVLAAVHLWHQRMLGENPFEQGPDGDGAPDAGPQGGGDQ